MELAILQDCRVIPIFSHIDSDLWHRDVFHKLTPQKGGADFKNIRCTVCLGA